VSEEPLIRNAFCHFCRDPLFYISDPRHEREVKVDVFCEGLDYVFYAHERCWDDALAPRPRKAT
jgi:hypothetical protein